MMPVEFIMIVYVHFIADFLYQDEEWATNKNHSITALLKHTTVYSLMWFVPTAIGNLDPINAVYFVLITFVAHTITDYFTSKAVTRLFKEKKYGSSIPNTGAFTVIGFDQMLHYIQLVLTYQLLFN